MKLSLVSLLVLLSLSIAARGQMLPKPQSGYVLDLAKLFDSATLKQIGRFSSASAKKNNAPIYIVTVPSLSSIGASSVETYADRILDAWKIGQRGSSKGMVLLVAKKDRKARIALGIGWKGRTDGMCEEIMSGKIVPRFKKNDYRGGVLAGVQALKEMADAGLPPEQVYGDEWVGGGSEETLAYSGDQMASIAKGIGGFCCMGFIGFIILGIAVNNRSGGSGYGSAWMNSGRYNNYHSGGSFHSSGISSHSSSRSSGGGGYSGGGGANGSW